MNHQTFTDLFDKLVLSMPIKDFIKQGYLAPYKYFSLKSDSDIQRTIDDIELDRFGEYKESSMEEKMDIGSIRAQLLDSYLSLAEGKRVSFMPSILLMPIIFVKNTSMLDIRQLVLIVRHLRLREKSWLTNSKKVRLIL